MDDRRKALHPARPHRHAWRVKLVAAGLLWLVATGAHAATYRCVDAQGQLAYRDTPCAPGANQREITLQSQPLIGDPREAAQRTPRRSPPDRRPRPHARAAHPRAPKPVMAWECRAADGEVFYRHTRCPSSIPGDGVLRWDDPRANGGTGRRRSNAWSRVKVHGQKIPRAEACRRIRSVTASSRDGHAHDDDVSVYDRLMGRDPCHGA